jgi:ABC-type bacteriocin/lantibiotic exporter with double-glycine peptidase domain
MTMSDSQRISEQQIRIFQSELALETPLEVSGDPNLILLGKTLQVLGVRNPPLRSIEGASIRLILETNDLYYRDVETPKQPGRGEFQPLIVFEQVSGNPMLLYRDGLHNTIFCPRQNCSWRLASHGTEGLPMLEPIALELFAPLQGVVSGPLALLRFIFSAKALRTSMLSVLICSAVIIGFNLLVPLLTRFLVRRVLPDADGALLLFSTMIAVIVILGLSVASYLQSRMLLRIQTIADRRVQSAIWERLLKLPMRFLGSFNAGDLASRAQAVTQLQQVLSNTVISSGLSLFFSFAYFILMFAFDRGLALWALLFTAVSLLIVAALSIAQVRLQRPLQEVSADITNFALQAMYGLPQIRSAGTETHVLLRWLNKVNNYSLTQLNINQFADAQLVYANTVGSIGLMLMFVVLTRRILNANDVYSLSMVVVAFLSFNSAFQMFNSAISSVISQIASVIGQSVVLWERATPIFAEAQEPGYQSSAILHALDGHFHFQHVALRFASANEPLFVDLNFETIAGGHTAITGSTGSGKTTVIRMMLGFIEPDQGEVLVDDVPISKLAIRQYRRQIGVVMQSIRFGSGSIYNLIRCGLPISRDEVWACLEKTGFADEVNYLPLKLDTFISEGASNLSGGQRQKLAIARALVRQPRVLLMDEATSALDNASQDRVTKIIEELGVTRITVAHRLSTIRSADHLVVLEAGRVLESGAPSELLAQGGYLQRNLSASQA